MHYEKFSFTQHSVLFTYHFCLLGGKSGKKKNKKEEMILAKHCSQCKLLGITTLSVKTNEGKIECSNPNPNPCLQVEGVHQKLFL